MQAISNMVPSVINISKLFFGVRVNVFYKSEKFIVIFFLFSRSFFDPSRTLTALKT